MHQACYISIHLFLFIIYHSFHPILLNIDSRACGGNCFANDTQRSVPKVGHSPPQRSSFVWTTWNWEDIDGSCMCCTDKCDVPEISWSTISPGNYLFQLKSSIDYHLFFFLVTMLIFIWCSWGGNSYVVDHHCLLVLHRCQFDCMVL